MERDLYCGSTIRLDVPAPHVMSNGAVVDGAALADAAGPAWVVEDDRFEG